MLWNSICYKTGSGKQPARFTARSTPRDKDYILPLLFYKRLDDVYSDELTNFTHGIGLDNATAQAMLDADRTLVRFCLPAHV